jgi:hypothetical protein
MKLNYPSISAEQGNQVSLLPSAPQQLKSLRDNRNREVLKSYIPLSKTSLADLVINKRYSQKYDIVLPKLFIMTHQRALCVHLIRHYTLKGKDITRTNIMCLPCLIQQMVQHNIFTDCLKVTVPSKGKGK